MKGISHFSSAIAAATFVPGVVAASAHDQSLVLLLTGAFGLMPDWLDFKFARYFERPNETIIPDPARFDAQAIARQVAEALDRAYNSGEPLSVQLDTMPLGGDRYRQYTLRFDNEHNEVVIALGPVVNSSQRPLTPTPLADPESEANGARPHTGSAKVNAKLNYTYDGDMKIDIFEGPSFEFRREADTVEVSFLPWHRRWTHSLVLGAAFGVATGLLFGVMAGLVVTVAYWTHVLEDQLGHLGSNLFWPLTTRRSSGLKLLHSGDPLPNFLTVWSSAMFVLYNLNRFAPLPQFDGYVFLLWVVGLPAAVMIGAMIYQSQGRAAIRDEAAHDETERGGEALAEVEEVQV